MREFAKVQIKKNDKDNTVEYFCSECGKKLMDVEMEYYKDNMEMATEDTPLQLRKEHIVYGCPRLQEKAEKALSILETIEPNIKITVEEMYDSLAVLGIGIANIKNRRR